MTHPAAGVPHPRPPDPGRGAARRADARAGRRRPPRPRAAAARRRARHRQDPHAHAPRRAPAGHRRAPRRGEILAVTFSVRAAGELRLRLADLLGEQTARGVTAATFHSVCARLLREHAGAVRPHRHLHDLRPGRRAPRDRARCSPTARRGEIQAAIARCGQPVGGRARDRDRAGQEPAAGPRARSSGPLAPGGGPLVAAVWRAVERELERCNAWSFDDLLVFAVRLLREHPHGSRTCARAGAGWWSTRCRTPTRRRPRSCTCWPGRRQPDRGRRRRPG